MKKHFNVFNGNYEYSMNIDGESFPNMSILKSLKKAIYTPNIDYFSTPLTFRLVSGGSICWKGLEKTIKYSLNGGAWTEITSSSTGVKVYGAAGDIISFKATNTTYGASTSSFASFDGSDASFNVYGNIMSLIDEDNFTSISTLSANYTFYSLFKGLKVIHAKNLILPAMTVSNYCYASMFQNCVQLLSAPELYATTIGTYCYSDMFNGCTALSTITKKLPAVTLTDHCYYNMFLNCTHILKTPTILGTTTATYCCANMFKGCTLLSNTCNLLSENTATYCYSHMYDGCSSLSDSPQTLKGGHISDYAYEYMFNNCSSLISAPEILSNTAGEGSCVHMFYGCSRINYIKCSIQYSEFMSSYFTDWTNGVAASGTFNKLEAAEWPIGVNGIPTGWTVTTIAKDYSKEYLTFTITSDGNITWASCGDSTTTSSATCGNGKFPISYSKDNGETWTEISPTTQYSISGSSITSYTYYVNIPVVSGDVVLIKGNNDTYNYGYYGNITDGYFLLNTFGLSTANYIVSGNIMSLIYGDDFIGKTLLKENSCFRSLFTKLTTYHQGGWSSQFYYNRSSNTKLLDASNLILPATTLTDSCYERMFYQCSNLSGASKILPATTLADYCYSYMFYNCTSLITAPALPATTLADYCYDHMFNYCSSLTIAPVLPATVMFDYCYSNMFNGCSSLTTAPVLPATTLAQSCYNNMFSGCTSLNTAPELPATTLASYCYYDMFSRCTSLTTAPVLPATTLADNCYESMFIGCKSLTTAPALTATTLADNCYSGMFSGCTSLTTAPELSATTLASYCYASMFYGCTSLTTAPELPVTTLADYCYQYMFYGCTSLTTPPELPATILADYCYQYMFQGCTSLITAPELPATVLKQYCYSAMFSSCTKITETTELPATTLAPYCYDNMFNGCSKLITISTIYATTLASYCCNFMFAYCSSLTSAPSLLATTLASNCYANMFVGCSKLTTIPELPATTLVDNCYSGMFQGCTSLISITGFDAISIGSHSCLEMFRGCTNLQSVNLQFTSIGSSGCYHMFDSCSNLESVSFSCITIGDYGCNYMFQNCTKLNNVTLNITTSVGSYGCSSMFYNCTSLLSINSSALSATSLATYCYDNMFRGCTSLTTAPVLPATSLANYCYCGMFSGCTSLTTAPELPATNIQYSCYVSMFSGCTSLTTAPELPATKLANNCYDNMFYGCTSLTTAPELPATILADYCYANMFYGCTSLTTAPELPATVLKTYCYQYMFYRCTSLITAPELPATTLALYCYQYMFQGCTSLITAPELPATTLVNNCYSYMFYGCTNLNYVKCLAKENITSSYLNYWLNNVSASGTFIIDPEATTWQTGVTYGIPSGWTILVNNDQGLQVTSDSKYGESNTIKCVNNETSLSMTFYLRSDYTYQINTPAWVSGTISKDTSKSFENRLDYLTLSLTITENNTGSDRTGTASLIIYDENNNQFTKSIIFNITQLTISQYVNVNLNNTFINDGTDGSYTIYKYTWSSNNYYSGNYSMYITINGYSTFTLQVKNYNQNSTWTRVIIGKLDTEPLPGSSSSTMTDSMYWNGANYAYSAEFNTVTFTDIPEGEHTIHIKYIKNSSGSSSSYGAWIKVPDVTDEQ